MRIFFRKGVFIMSSFVLKGDICYSVSPTEMKSYENAFLVCVDGISKGVFTSLPKVYEALPLYDYTNQLILPGLIDLHLHAPQFSFRGTKMDLELMDWLDQNAFVEEMKYSDLEYAQRAYHIFAEELKKSATTRACIFSSKHKEATKLLMNELEQTGLITYVGKVNMDREAPEALLDASPEESLEVTRSIIEEAKAYQRTKPIITPRFIPCCSSRLMAGLGQLAEEYHLPVQSHLSENKGEISWVTNHYPMLAYYGAGYDRYGLFGKSLQGQDAPTIMAHCVWSEEAELKQMKKNGVWVAHCPASNANLSSGIAPIRKYLEEGIRVGLGSDIGAGQSNSIFRTIIDSIQVSKLYWRLVDETKKPLQFKEAFYLATLGGGSFFDQVGSFDEGFAVDVLVCDDRVFPHPQKLSVLERVERFSYLAGDLIGITAKFVNGEKIV